MKKIITGFFLIVSSFLISPQAQAVIVVEMMVSDTVIHVGESFDLVAKVTNFPANEQPLSYETGMTFDGNFLTNSLNFTPTAPFFEGVEFGDPVLGDLFAVNGPSVPVFSRGTVSTGELLVLGQLAGGPGPAYTVPPEFILYKTTFEGIAPGTTTLDYFDNPLFIHSGTPGGLPLVSPFSQEITILASGPSAIPEPSTMILTGLGLAFAGFRKKFKRA